MRESFRSTGSSACRFQTSRILTNIQCFYEGPYWGLGSACDMVVITNAESKEMCHHNELQIVN
jgi:hypothetical protein